MAQVHITALEAQISVELGGEVGIFGSAPSRIAHVLAHAAELHITRLRHEALDHAVKDDVVIGALLGQRRDALDMQGGHLFKEVDDDGALGLSGDVDLDAGGGGGCRQKGKNKGQLTHLRPP